MGMGANAVAVATVEIEDIEKLNLKTFNTMINLLEENKLELNYLAENVKFEDGVESFGKLGDGEFQIATSYTRFKQEFKDRFNVSIDLDYHPGDEIGDIYDDLDESYFRLNMFEIYELSNDGEKLNNVLPIELKQFVEHS